MSTLSCHLPDLLEIATSRPICGVRQRHRRVARAGEFGPLTCCSPSTLPRFTNVKSGSSVADSLMTAVHDAGVQRHARAARRLGGTVVGADTAASVGAAQEVGPDVRHRRRPRGWSRWPCRTRRRRRCSRRGGGASPCRAPPPSEVRRLARSTSKSVSTRISDGDSSACPPPSCMPAGRASIVEAVGDDAVHVAVARRSASPCGWRSSARPCRRAPACRRWRAPWRRARRRRGSRSGCRGSASASR